MTYCLAINTHQGLVLCSDSRTNAGFDNVSSYSKTHTFVWPGQRFIAIMSAGNLATTQQVLKRIRHDIATEAETNFLNVPNMQDAADYIGSISSHMQKLHSARDTGNTSFEASFIIAGQIGNQPPETLLIYPQGNFIHESDEHPYLQIGEIKYGKPILDRIITRDIDLNRAARCAMVSMNSTIRSNLTVGPPVDLVIYRRDTLDITHRLLMNESDAFSKQIADAWSSGLVLALDNLPIFEWEKSSQT